MNADHDEEVNALLLYWEAVLFAQSYGQWAERELPRLASIPGNKERVKRIARIGLATLARQERRGQKAHAHRP